MKQVNKLMGIEGILGITATALTIMGATVGFFIRIINKQTIHSQKLSVLEERVDQIDVSMSTNADKLDEVKKDVGEVKESLSSIVGSLKVLTDVNQQVLSQIIKK